MDASKVLPAENPFPAAPNPQWYVSVEGTESVRTRLLSAVERRECPALLVGPAGTGKTLLCEILAETFRETFDVVLLAETRLCTRKALLQHILHHLGLPFADRSEGELRLALIDRATQTADDGKQGMLIIVDEAQGMPGRLLEELRMISGIVRGGQPKVQLVLAGRSSLDERLAHPKMEPLAQRIATRCYLHPFSQREVAQYVKGAFGLAQVDGDSVIDAQALQSVYFASDGVPRLINQTVGRAVTLAQELGATEITSEVIDNAWAELQQLPSPVHDLPADIGEERANRITNGLNTSDQPATIEFVFGGETLNPDSEEAHLGPTDASHAVDEDVAESFDEVAEAGRSLSDEAEEFPRFRVHSEDELEESTGGFEVSSDNENFGNDEGTLETIETLQTAAAESTDGVTETEFPENEVAGAQSTEVSHSENEDNTVVTDASRGETVETHGGGCSECSLEDHAELVVISGADPDSLGDYEVEYDPMAETTDYHPQPIATPAESSLAANETNESPLETRDDAAAQTDAVPAAETHESTEFANENATEFSSDASSANAVSTADFGDTSLDALFGDGFEREQPIAVSSEPTNRELSADEVLEITGVAPYEQFGPTAELDVHSRDDARQNAEFDTGSLSTDEIARDELAVHEAVVEINREASEGLADFRQFIGTEPPTIDAETLHWEEEASTEYSSLDFQPDLEDLAAAFQSELIESPQAEFEIDSDASITADPVNENPESGSQVEHVEESFRDITIQDDSDMLVIEDDISLDDDSPALPPRNYREGLGAGPDAQSILNQMRDG